LPLSTIRLISSTEWLKGESTQQLPGFNLLIGYKPPQKQYPINTYSYPKRKKMTTRVETPLENQFPGIVRGRLIWISLLAMSVSIAFNLGLYAVVGYLFPHVAAWPGTSPMHIIASTIVYLLLATLVFAVVRRLSSRPARHYLIVATISLLISFGPPISAGFGPGLPGVPPADIAIVITLGLMHVISYALSVPLFIRLAWD
jgi:hypothetical protein